MKILRKTHEIIFYNTLIQGVINIIFPVEKEREREKQIEAERD